MSKTLLFLHGALGSESQLLPLKEMLKGECDVHSFNFAGHGGKVLPETFSIKLFVEETVLFCEANALKSVSIFGYSMGGYVALYLAKHYPHLVESVITLGTKLNWDETVAAKEVKMMQPDIIEQKVPAFAAQLQKQHNPADWKIVMTKTAHMLTEMGRNNPLQTPDYNDIQCPVLLMLGDRDKMVTMDETVAAYQLLPKAQLSILPGTPHAIEQVDVEMVNLLVRKFI